MPAQAFLSSDDQNLWPVMSQQFKISTNGKNTDVQRQVDWDLRNPKYIHMLTKNAKPYLYYVFQETKKLHLPAELALLPMIESDYIPYGDSDRGAVGLWQLMPDTAYNYGVKMNYFYDGRRSTTVSTKVALTFLSYLYQEFHHNWLLALAAYDAGPGTVAAAIKYNREHGRPTDFWALPLPKETEAYIPKLLALATIIQHPHAYGIHLASVPDKAVTSTVTITKEMKLKTIAHLAHTSVTTVKKLNPALRRSVTPPHQIVTLVLPANEKKVFVKRLAVHKKIQREVAEKDLNHYTVKHGDSLSSIAAKFKTTVAILQKINQLHNGSIKINQALWVPKIISAIDSQKPIKTVHDKSKVLSKRTKKLIARNEQLYIVKRGDNLHRLSAEFDTTTYHIMEHNHLHSADLQVGERLLLPNA